MYNGSSNYKTGIYATSRMNKGRVTFDISDTTASGDVASISTTSESALSNKAHLVDKIRQSTFKLATMEKDRFALDGNWTFPDENLVNNGEIGWVSDVICDATGVFAVPPQFTINFNANHSSIGLTISFDPVNGEYATDFTMVAYDASNNVLASYPYTGNKLTQVAAYGQLSNYRKVGVIINKWSVPNRRCRVSEVDFGIVKIYTGDTGLVSMGLTEEMDLTSASIPSPEFKFTVDNSSREFNILSPTGFYKSLQQKQQVQAEIGLAYDDGSVEWIPVGNYQLNEWVSDEGALTTTFYARTKLDLMSSFDFENLSAVPQSLAAMARYIFSICGITNYYIDPALELVSTTAVVKKTNCKNVLQMIAIAGCANVFVTRNNVITLKCNRTRKVRYIRDWTNGSNANIGNYWIEVQALNTSGTNIALGKTVTASSLGGEGTPSLVTDGSTATVPYFAGSTGLQNVMVDLGAVYDIATVNVWHFWSDNRVFNNSKTEVSADGVNWVTVYDSAISGTYAESSAGRSYSLETVRDNAASVDTISMNDQYAEPKIVLENPVKQVQVSYYTDVNTAVPVSVNSASTVGDTLKLEGNTLITTSARATAVANWIIAQKNNRAVFTANWRGNQAHELADVVGIGNSYGADMNAYITKTELKYEGYVQATTEARGVAN